MPLRDSFSRLDIIGRGPLETEVERRASACAQFHFLGVKTNREVQERMRAGDLLVLPSLYDGWGTVVNEALQNGMRVLCSDELPSCWTAASGEPPSPPPAVKT